MLQYIDPDIHRRLTRAGFLTDTSVASVSADSESGESDSTHEDINLKQFAVCQIAH
jgi:hypothetical protein